MKILLVEDSPVDRMFVTQSLRRVDDFEYELVLATSLADALRQLKAASFHVILLDLGLPDCEGGETCRRIVAAAHDVPVVVLTGSDDRNLATQAIRSGAGLSRKRSIPGLGHRAGAAVCDRPLPVP